MELNVMKNLRSNWRTLHSVEDLGWRRNSQSSDKAGLIAGQFPQSRPYGLKLNGPGAIYQKETKELAMLARATTAVLGRQEHVEGMHITQHIKRTSLQTRYMTRESM